MTGIAQDALKYAGHGYTFGGVPANGQWDCSSFVNMVVGMDLGMAIPGYNAGKYDGKTHGPVVMDWATWTGATTVSSPQQDDLCVWAGFGALGHIGIATDPQHMISALNTHSGTVHTPIAGYGPGSVPVIYRRLVDTAGNASTSAGVSLPGCMPLISPLLLSGVIYLAKRLRR
jgi:cell wall-associated NlpC family hydrolase